MSQTNEANGFLELRTNEEIRSKVQARLANFKKALLDKNRWNTLDALAQQALEDALGQSVAPRFELKDHVVYEIDRLPDEKIERYLSYRYAYDVFPHQHTIAQYPPCLQIEPTSICNYRCVFCYQTDEKFSQKSSPHMGTMSIDLFKDIIDQAVGNIEAVTLASRGEPLSAKALPEMLAYMRGKFIASKLNTNASLLTEKRAHMLLESDLQTIVFSADAATEPLYSQLRVRGSLDVVLRNIERFQNIRSKHYSNSQVITRVSGVVVDDRQDSAQMEALWGGLVDQVAFVSFNAWKDAYTADTNDIKTPCSELWRRMFIWWDGKIAPCDADYKTQLLSEQFPGSTLADLWRGASFEELRENHLRENRKCKSPCSGCVLV